MNDFSQRTLQKAPALLPPPPEARERPDMESSTITWIWLIAGVALAVSEAFVPGFIIIFFGVAAMLVAGLRALGLVESLLPCLLIWAALSTGLVFGVGRFFRKKIQSERTVAVTDEDASVFGRVVEVVDAIEPGQEGGRIRFQGTTWSARTVKGQLPAGSQARLVDRDNLCWIVEPIVTEASLPPRAALFERPSAPETSDSEKR